MKPSFFVLGVAFTFAGARHHQKKSLITFLAIFGSLFYVGNGAGR